MYHEEVNTLYVESQAILEEIIKACRAYHNATVVIQYYDRYGYTKHFKMLIGEENLVDEAKTVVGKFIAWVKELITRLISKLTELFHIAKLKIARFLGLQKTPDDFNTIQKQINNKLDLIAASMGGSISTKFHTDRISIATQRAVAYIISGPASDTIEKYTVKTAEWVAQVRETCKEHSTYMSVRRSIVRDNARDVSKATGILMTIVNSLCINLREFKENIYPGMSKSEFFNEVDLLIEASPNTFNKSLLNQDIDDVVKHITTIIHTMLIASNNLINITFAYLTKLDEDVNKCVRVHVAADPNPNMTHRLESQFGGTLDVRKIVVTNMDPETWEISNDTPDKRPACGWCYTGNNRSGARDLFVNYRWYSQLGRSVRDVHFIRTVVHECFHLFRTQHGLNTGSVTIEESLATAAEKAYSITADDRSWVRSVIARIEHNT